MITTTGQHIKANIAQIPSFLAQLSPQARALLDTQGPRSAYLPGRDGVEPILSFSKTCHWPPNSWYQERMADTINRLVAGGKIVAIIGYGAILLASGKIVDGLEETDLGPDQNCCIICPFRSLFTVDELNTFLGAELSRPIRHEGEVGGNVWFDLVPRKSLIDPPKGG